MPQLNLAQLALGERVQHEFLVFDRVEKKTNSGDPFVILTLGNAVGRIETAPVWSDKLEWVEGAESGRIVQAIGNVALYGRNGTAKRQLQLTAPVRPLPVEQFRVDDFLPRIQGDPERYWSWIDDTVARMESARLRSVLDLFFRDDAFRVAFERAPGSTGGHHACIGGLLLHVFEVTNIAKQTARTVKKANVDLVVAGALLHDIGKVEAYTTGPGGFTFTPCGLLVGHVVLGVMMLERRIAEAGRLSSLPPCSPGQLLDLQHMILSHHGKLEFGSPVEPMTVEAEIVHWADEASAKATDMMDALDDDDAFHSGGEVSDKKVWRVGRRVWRRPHGWE